MNEQIIQIAARIRELREILEKTPEEVAAKVGITPEEYIRYENAEDDIPIGVLYAVAADFGVTQVVDANWGVHGSIHKSVFSCE